jgi:class 3 adenylate cyclase/tetratricopeptide (TPR) repeat protein
MSTSLNEQIEQLKNTITEMESQRALLGNDTITAALIPLKEKLAMLEAQVEPPDPVQPTQQRKLATILFMDMAGSTEMTRDLDPEDQMALVDPLIARLAERVSEFGGHVARFTGDGFKAVFGLPVARENDPEQAIRAGLTIQAEASKVAAELESEHEITEFKVRVGISTGLVFAGGDTEGEDTIKGTPVNLAARLENAASPGGLLISHDTYRHVRGVFNVEPIDPISAKGFPEPVPVYLVREIKPRAFRVQTRGVEGVETRMVGRNAELKFLQDALLTAFEEGEGQVVTITGEAGVGKSRLLYEFQNWIELLPASQSVWFFQGRGRQEAQRLHYSLLRDLFAFRFQILDDDTGEQALRKIESGFGEVFGSDEDGMMQTHILGQLLGFDFSASPHMRGVLNDAEQLRNRGLMYLVEYFQTLSQDSPNVIFLEDIHWADDSSLDAIDWLAERSSDLNMLILCATRSRLFERRPNWGKDESYHAKLWLNPLTGADSIHLMKEILKFTKEVPDKLMELVSSRAEGNPFYLEEIIKMLIEDGVVLPGEDSWRIEAGNFSRIEVPPTLAGVLQARLEILTQSERAVLQQASVVGRTFWDRLVGHLQAEGLDQNNLPDVPSALVSLQDRELIYRQDESTFSDTFEFIFKHDILRDVTYESVLKRLRITYHGLVADWLIANSGDRISEHSGFMAEHLLLAGRDEQASGYFFRAGEKALASYANAEAEHFYRQVLKLSPPSPLRAGTQTGLGEALYRQGRSNEATKAWQRAIELHKEVGDSDGLGDTYARLSRLIWLEDHLEAWNLCQESLDLLEGAPESRGYARLLAEAGRTAHFRNEIDQVVPLCQRAMDMAEDVEDLEVWAEARITLSLTLEDPKDSINILKEIIVMIEGEGLLRTISRAHINLAAFYNKEFDLRYSHEHWLLAAEINRKIGETDLMLFCLSGVLICLIDLGELKSLEDKLAKFLLKSSAPRSRIKVFTQTDPYYGIFLRAKGEWGAAMEKMQGIKDNLKHGGSFQEISDNNLHLANTILELNRFGFKEDISEAVTALEDNIQINWFSKSSYFRLAVASARQARIADARDLLIEAENDQSYPEGYQSKQHHLQVEFELAYAEKHWGEAVKACKSLLETYQPSGYRWRWARQLIDLGDALVGRNEPGDLEQARETYQQSLEMFTEMGASGYVEVLEARLGEIGPR